MRTRRNHDSAADKSSLPSIQRLAAMTGVVTACAVALAGACGDAQTNSSGSGATGNSSSSGGMGGMGGGDLSVVAGSQTVGSGITSASSSSSGEPLPACPKSDPNGGSTKSASAFGDASAQSGGAIAFDKSGDILLAGSFSGSVTFGGTTLTSKGDTDVFLVKFNSAGQVLWAKSFGDPLVQTAAGVSVDANGNVYLTGNFRGTINLGGSNLPYQGNLFVDVYLAKFTSDGTHVWSKSFGDPNVQAVRGLATDTAGNVVIVGNFQNDVNFGGATLTSAGYMDAFIAKFDTMGVHQWSRRYGEATADQFARSVAIDATGNVYVSGDAAVSIDFGMGSMPATSSTAAFVAKLDSLGNAQWVKLGNGEAAGKSVGTSVAVAANGDVAVGGSFQGKFDLGGTPVTGAGTDDAFVTVFSSAGVHSWTKTFGDSQAQTVTAVEFAPNNEVFAAGNFTGSIDFDSGEVKTSAGGFDGFLVRLNSKACPVWIRAYPGNQAHSTTAMAVDPTTGGVALTGSFNGTTDLGTGTITAAGDDVFLLSVNP